MLRQLGWAKARLATAALVVAILAAGCNDRQSDVSRGEAGPAGAAKNDSVDPKPAPPQPQTDSPQHPAVSTQVDPDDEPSPPSDHAPAANEHSDNEHSDNKQPAPIAPPPPGSLPDVALSSAHRATCKLFIGDQLPLATLADLDSNATPLETLLGRRATVVMFWQHDDPDGVEAITDLQPLVLSRYGEHNVRVVAIHAGDTVAEVKSIAEQHQLKFPMLIDADFAAFSQITDAPHGLMPRVFLVDSAGRILWFDIEYSRTTRRDLDRALRALTHP